MNHKTYSIFALALVFLAAAFLSGCSSSAPPTIAITATGGATQTQTITEAFPTALGVNVTSNGSPATGVTVTFAAGTSSGGATCTPSTPTATTDANGNASTTCTANSTAGAYTVTATATGATTPASFSLTNAPPSVFTYYVSGLENINGPEYYAVAGAVAFDLSGVPFPDANGNCGEQDYNDGDAAVSSPGEPTTPDTIAASTASMVVNSTTGTGILTLVSSNTNVGVKGTETFAVQFINSSHALITQFDGSATSSGSMDLQSPITDSNWAFTISGIDTDDDPVAYGGIFTVASGAITGTVDVNDDGTATPASAPGNLTGSVTAKPDAYGRGTATLTANGTVTLSLAYYEVTAEAMRLIDVDLATDTATAGGPAVGSAIGQGATPAFDSTALGTADVIGVQGNSSGVSYAEAGSLTPSGTAGQANGTFTGGEADANWEGSVVSDAALTVGADSVYTIAASGYGSASVQLPDVATLPYGLYATLSTVNLLDPNNTSGGGGALLLDLFDSLSGGTGVVVPQGATTSTDFNGLSYGFGAQEFNDSGTLPSGDVGWEFDYVAQGSWTALGLTGGGLINDPFAYFVSGTAGEYGTSAAPIAIAGTATGPDAAGRYTFAVPPAAGDFAVGPVGTGGPTDAFTVALYEANPALVFSIDEDTSTATPPVYSLWLGTYQEQSAASLKAMHFKNKAVPKAQAKRKP